MTLTHRNRTLSAAAQVKGVLEQQLDGDVAAYVVPYRTMLDRL
jgi:hypothetical protein